MNEADRLVSRTSETSEIQVEQTLRPQTLDEYIGQRELIEAAFCDGYTHQELSERFGLPLGTVKTRIRSGLLAMRERLEHYV